MTITRCKEDEEHILTSYPDDHFVEILTKMLDDIHHCTSTVNSKSGLSIGDLSKELENTARLEVYHSTRDAPVSLGLRDF